MARARYERDGIHCRIDNLGDVVRTLNATPEQLAEAERLTCSDLRTWVPGAVSSATSKVYNITKAEVANIKGKYSIETGYSDRGRNAGKGNVRVSSTGDRLSSIAWVFKGRKHADWTTRAGKQKRVPKARRRITKGGKTYSVPKPYETTVETYKRVRTPIRGRNGNRVFVMDGKHGLRAMVVKAGTRMTLAHGSSSIPQAIMHERVVAIWQPKLIRKAEDRFMHHSNRIFSKR